MFTLDQIVAAFLLGALTVVGVFLLWYHWPRPSEERKQVERLARQNWKRWHSGG